MHNYLLPYVLNSRLVATRAYVWNLIEVFAQAGVPATVEWHGHAVFLEGGGGDQHV